jgi:large subunit ribosomal protein L20
MCVLMQVRKRDFRKLWIQRINAGSRMYGVNYNSLVCGLIRGGFQLNRKVLSDLAITEPLSFKAVVDVVKQDAKYSKTGANH